MIRRLFALCVLAVAASAARADSYIVFTDDRAGFEASLDVDPLSTVIDTGGAFAANPTAATGLASVTRSGSIAGHTFTWAGYDINFSNSPTGTLTPGTAGGDIASTTPVDIETPAVQGSATGAGSWGLDGGSGSTTSRNALLADFTTTPGGLGIGHFGLDLIDFEASAAFTRGTLRLYRGGSLVFTQDFDWGAQDGNNQVHFLGVVASSAALFDQVVVVLGDDSSGGGNAETWAADRFTFGQATQVPEPATLTLTGLGVASLAAWVRRRRRAAAPAAGDGPAPT
jgi:PEP-CTERM motif-containing protein